MPESLKAQEALAAREALRRAFPTGPGRVNEDAAECDGRVYDIQQYRGRVRTLAIPTVRDDVTTSVSAHTRPCESGTTRSGC